MENYRSEGIFKIWDFCKFYGVRHYDFAMIWSGICLSGKIIE
jgi:hypothetical protein